MSIIIGSHSGPCYSICSGPDNNFLTSGSDKIVAFWDGLKCNPVNLSIKIDSPAYALNYDEKQSILFIGSNSGNIHWIDLKEKKEIKNFTLHKKGVFDLKIIPENNLLISTGGDGTLGVWDIKNKKLIRNIPLSEAKLRRADYKDSLLAVCCGDGFVRILETENFNEIKTLQAHDKSANCALFTQEGLITGGWDGQLMKWDNNYNLIKKIPAHNYAIYALTDITGSDFFASASRDKSIKIWNKKNLEIIDKLDYKKGGHHSSVNDLLFINKTLFSVGDDGKVIAWKFTF